MMWRMLVGLALLFRVSAGCTGGASGALAAADSVSFIQQSPLVIPPYPDFVYPLDAEMLDGGASAWKLFELFVAPGGPSPYSVKETFRNANPELLTAIKCMPGDDKGKWFHDVSEPALVPFLVPRTASNFHNATVIIAPGGAFKLLAWYKEGTRIAKWLNSIGFSAFVLKYRVSSNSMVPLPRGEDDDWPPVGAPAQTKPPWLQRSTADAQRAVSLVRSRAPGLGLDPARIGFIGFSAGGVLAMSVATETQRAYTEWNLENISFKPDFVALVYSAPDPGSLASYEDHPTTFIAIAHDDQCASMYSALKYHQKLSWHGVPAELHVFSNGGRHGYGDCSMYIDGGNWSDVCAWTANLEEFLLGRVMGIQRALGWARTGRRRAALTNEMTGSAL